MNKKLRTSMLALFAAGLLLVGAGVGLCIVEFTAFTYREPVALTDTEPRAQCLTLLRSEDSQNIGDGSENRHSFSCPVHLNVYIPGAHLITPQILPKDEVPSGTLEVQVHYTGVPGAVISTNLYTTTFSAADEPEREEPVREANLFWSSDMSDLEYLILMKDAVLKDLRNEELGEFYDTRLNDLVVYANPQEVDRISVHLEG